MRLEHIPLILGVIVALIGLGFIADASMAAAAPVTPERRRRTRAEPSRTGEALVGIGTLAMAAALFGRDTWRYGTVAVLAGSALLLIGVIFNRAFLKEALLFRGPARRSDGGVPAEARRTAGAPAGGQRPAARPPGPRPAASGGSAPAPGPHVVRHPTPPLASRAYQPPPAVPSPSAPATGGADGNPSSPTGGSRPLPAAEKGREAPPPTARPEPPPGPKERRKTPRGKR